MGGVTLNVLAFVLRCCSCLKLGGLLESQGINYRVELVFKLVTLQRQTELQVLMK